ncbi:MAG: endonuclease/exonuclease/phosphatase family protein [Candidatus Binatia bacterium]
MTLRVRLICWNLHGAPITSRLRQPRMRAAAQRILDIEPLPDVVVLQEIFYPADADLLERTLGARYQRVGGIPTKPFPPWFLPFVDLAGLFMRIRKGGLLAFVSHKWDVLQARFEKFDAEECEYRIWHGDGYADKGIQRLDLRHRPSRQTLVILNTHLQSGGAYAAVRSAQVQQLATMASSVEPGVPVLIAGDFNVRPAAPLYDTMVEHLAWQDLTTQLPNCGTHFDRNAKHGRWRDYVFARHDAAWRAEAEVDLICNWWRDMPYSDHHGIDARIRLSRRSGTDVSWRALAARVLSGPSTRRAWLLAAGAVLLDWTHTCRRGG